MVAVSRRAWPSRSATVFIGKSRRTIRDAKARRNRWVPGRGTMTPARRSALVAMAVTLDPPSCRYGGSAVTKTTSGGLAEGREPGHTDDPVGPVDVLHREGCCLCCPEAEPAQQQQDGAVTTAVGTRLVHRGQHPLHLGIGEGPGQSGLLPFADCCRSSETADSEDR